MRSRYTAFCTKNVDYLLATRHPSKRKPGDREHLLQAVRETEWLGLRVMASEEVQDTRMRGFVEFVAFFRPRLSVHRPDRKGNLETGGPDLPNQLHEKSEFIKQQGRWFYVQGLTLPPIKIERNDPCWCGSRRKLKQCHGRLRS